MKVDQYISDLIQREGPYVDHPADRGGPTAWGVTEQVARAWGYKGRMQDLPQDTARDIYLERYWHRPGFDLVNDVSPSIAEELLDTGVNMGQSVASRFLQRALNVLNRQGKLYADVAVDGAVGRMTVAALRALLAARGQDGETVMLRALNSQQGERYIDIAEKTTSQEEFVYGWFLNRVT